MCLFVFVWSNDVFVLCKNIVFTITVEIVIIAVPSWLATNSKHRRPMRLKQKSKPRRGKQQIQIKHAFELSLTNRYFLCRKYNNKCRATVQSVHYHQTFKTHTHTYTYIKYRNILYYNQKGSKVIFFCHYYHFSSFYGLWINRVNHLIFILVLIKYITIILLPQPKLEFLCVLLFKSACKFNIPTLPLRTVSYRTVLFHIYILINYFISTFLANRFITIRTL